MDRAVSWFAMPIGVQISNVGSEVHRALRWKNKGDEQKKNSFCIKAIEFLKLMKEDPKNQHRKGGIIEKTSMCFRSCLCTNNSDLYVHVPAS